MDENNNAHIDHIGNEVPKADQRQAHGMTHAEMAELHIRQKNNIPVPMIFANNAGDNIRDPFFQDYKNHMIKKHEAHIYHVLCDDRLFHPQTGQKLSIVTLKKFTKEAFEFQKENHGFSGVNYILHNPELENRSNN